MRIIAVINEKGGSGKSTLSTNIATALHRRGKKVVLVDADPQGTARDWRNVSPEGVDLPAVVAMDRPQTLQTGLATLAGNDYIVIDGPAKAEAITEKIVRFAHIALIAIQPSGADVWASAPTVKIIKSKLNVGGQIEAAFVLNRTSESTKLSSFVKSGEWNEYEVDQLATTVGDRVAFAMALTNGVSVYDLPDHKARAEIDSIISEMEAAKWL
jgi:chromosome partitioning protein